MKKSSVLVLAAILSFWAMPAMGATNTLTMISSTPITAGATLMEYTWDIEDGMVKAGVIEIDLKNPYVQLELIPGQGKFTQRTTVSKMADRTGALAAINGDFYNTKAEGAPIGTAVIDGTLASSQSHLTGLYCLGITSDRTAYIESFGFQGSVTPATGKTHILSGLNKTVYWEEPNAIHSHIDKLHLYSDLWGSSSRGMDSYVGTPAEVLIKENRVQAVSFNGSFPYEVPTGSYILHGDGTEAEYIRNNFKVGDTVSLKYEVTPNKNWSMVVGGHALLVNEGQSVEYTKDLSALKGIRARTAAGISKDGKTLYLFAVEGRTSASQGITLGNLSLLMTKLGVWKAVNLDGGGSTTMVSRPLGETATKQVLAVEGHAGERSVVEALGIFSTAPMGQVKSITVIGNQQLLVGETANYKVQAYDEYYNTVTDTSRISMSETGGLGLMTNKIFLAKTPGDTTLVAQSGSTKVTYPIKIIGKDDLKKLDISLDAKHIEAGNTYPIHVKATLQDGTVKEVGSTALQWNLSGFEGNVSQAGLTVTAVGEGESGTVEASYDGFAAELKINFKEAEAITLQIGSNQLQKGDQVQTMDIAPVIENERTMVPLRFVSEAFGGQVLWTDDGNSQTAYVIYNETMIELPIGEHFMYVNGERQDLDVAPQILQERTMIPLRFVSEAFGMKVKFVDETQVITIES